MENVVSYGTAEKIRSEYNVYYLLSCFIAVNVSVSLLYSFNINILHSIRKKKVSV